MGRSVGSRPLRVPSQMTTFNLWKLQLLKASGQRGRGSWTTMLLFNDGERSRRGEERTVLAFRSGQRIAGNWTFSRTCGPTSSDNCSAWKLDSRIWREQFTKVTKFRSTKFGLKFQLRTFVNYTNRCSIGSLSAVKNGDFPLSFSLLLKLSVN